jgi:hypothetical protein
MTKEQAISDVISRAMSVHVAIDLGSVKDAAATASMLRGLGVSVGCDRSTLYISTRDLPLAPRRP